MPPESFKPRSLTAEPSTRTPPWSTKRSASVVEGAKPACFSSAPMPRDAPERLTSGMTSGTPPAARFWKSCSAASAAAEPWKREVISRASITLASLGLRPASTSDLSAAISASERKLSSVYQRHMSVSLMDKTLANIVFAGSVMPM